MSEIKGVTALPHTPSPTMQSHSRTTSSAARQWGTRWLMSYVSSSVSASWYLTFLSNALFCPRTCNSLGTFDCVEHAPGCSVSDPVCPGALHGGVRALGLVAVKRFASAPQIGLNDRVRVRVRSRMRIRIRQCAVSHSHSVSHLSSHSRSHKSAIQFYRICSSVSFFPGTFSPH
jgi:hypothetical protein